MPEHHGLWSIVPPLLAILLAMLSRQVVLSLLAGVLAGALILAGGNPIHALVGVAAGDLSAALIDRDHLQVFAFTLLMGAMVGVIQRMGGMHGLVVALSPLATNRRRGQIVTWLMGLIIFFDDYANTLLLGTTFRPVADRLKISREKLAYIVDSTAAPIAGLAVVSTWVAGEVGFIDAGLKDLGFGEANRGFAVFVQTIAYRFYPLLALLLVGAIAATRRDFGPMRVAEQRAVRESPRRHRDGAAAERREAEADETFSDKPPTGGAHLAVIPIVVVVIVLVGLLYATGLHDLPPDASLWEVVGNGDPYRSLVYASLTGMLTAMSLAVAQRRLSLGRTFGAGLAGARMMVPALAVLWLAWTLASQSAAPEALTGDRLGTAAYLTSLIGDQVPLPWMPALVFLLASAVSYCTGTSWGTMSILTPLVIRTTWSMLEASHANSLDEPLLLATIGSVLAGSIFGDHCSPISDTTILSSRASGCDHIAHVWTQMPYALFAAGVSVVAGTIPVGFGVSVWIALPASVILLLATLVMVGRPVDEEAADSRDASRSDG